MSVATADLTERNAHKLAFVFPGQGSQYVGMGKALFEASGAARRVFQQADEILGFKLSTLCFEGPADELEDTINAQPAILTVSLACLAAIRERLEALGQKWQPPRFVAGHSLGEYTALVAAGSLDFGDALRLVRERGRLMKEQGDHRPGGMAAVIGLDRQTLETACTQARQETHAVVSVANANSPEQFVISGDRVALDRAIELIRAAVRAHRGPAAHQHRVAFATHAAGGGAAGRNHRPLATPRSAGARRHQHCWPGAHERRPHSSRALDPDGRRPSSGSDRCARWPPTA